MTTVVLCCFKDDKPGLSANSCLASPGAGSGLLDMQVSPQSLQLWPPKNNCLRLTRSSSYVCHENLLPLSIHLGPFSDVHSSISFFNDALIFYCLEVIYVPDALLCYCFPVRELCDECLWIHVLNSIPRNTNLFVSSDKFLEACTFVCSVTDYL